METKVTSQIIGLKEDLEKEYTKIKKYVDYALLEVGIEMKNDLKQILMRDWYSKYKPLTYKRRTDDNALGTPLGDDENFDIYTKRQTLEFSYNPTGEHAYPEWHSRDGDNLIAWIQREHGYADSETGEIIHTIPSRPFWNNFLDEQMDGGFMEKFIKAMSSKYIVEEDSEDYYSLSDLARNYLPEDLEIHAI